MKTSLQNINHHILYTKANKLTIMEYKAVW